MAKSQIPPVSECIKSVRGGKILPVYFLCGEDSYMLDKAAEEVSGAVSRFIFSDFDKETVWGGEDKNLADILEIARAFPFGSEKKLLMIKDFEKFRDKKSLVPYINSPSESTVLLIKNNGSLSSSATEPFKSLLTNNFLFEAKELRGKNLAQWICESAAEKDKIISYENAQMLIDISGENRSIIEDQLEKICTFTGEKREITHQDIKFLAAEMKEFNIFDLLKAVGQKDKSAAFRYSYNLLEKGKEPVYIVFMLTRYFLTLSRIEEVVNKNLSSFAAAKELGILEWTYKDYISARKNYSERQLGTAVDALLKADVSIKTTSIDDKTVISVLLGEILSV